MKGSAIRRALRSGRPSYDPQTRRVLVVALEASRDDVYHAMRGRSSLQHAWQRPLAEATLWAKVTETGTWRGWTWVEWCVKPWHVRQFASAATRFVTRAQRAGLRPRVWRSPSSPSELMSDDSFGYCARCRSPMEGRYQARLLSWDCWDLSLWCPRCDVDVRVNPLHGYYRPDHLERVIGEMRQIGPPALRASWDEEGGMWHAREGTHRLRAALALGMAPVLIPVPWRRSRDSLVRARHAAMRHAHVFPRVEVRS